MTNEMLADCIAKSRNDEYIRILWENVNRLLYLKADKIYYALKERFTAAGVDENDMKQECYFVFLEALKAYKPPLKFVTFLEFPFKKMVSRLLKSNLKAQELYTQSLEVEQYEEEKSLSETLADEKNDIFRIVDERTDSEIVRGEVEKLGDRQKMVIKLYYFADMSDAEIADISGKKTESVCQLRHRALLQLKRSAVLQRLYFQTFFHGKSGFLNPERFYLKGKI
ncbi:MAG: sigma-70 family RNA polymerase sigma factor [Ruminococcus sp.]|nr:sigma-70 family RNA polymerase sigma factor [Ruminococcus sp.]